MSTDTPTVVSLLREYAQRTALRGGNQYRAEAYSRAADSLATLALPLDVLIAEGRLTEIPGVGDAIADIITKLHRTGSHPSLEKLRKEIPASVLEMLTVPGLRPEKILRLYKDLGITSLAELEAAAKEDRIRKTKGLGAALQTKILQNLAIAMSGQGRLHMHRAAALLEHAMESLRRARPELKRLTVAGEFRRGCELVGDYAIVAEAPAGKKPALVESGGLRVHVADRGHFGAVLRHATGSAAHLKGLRVLAQQQGMSLQPDGLHKGRSVVASLPPTKKTSTAPLVCLSSNRNCARGAAKSNVHWKGSFPSSSRIAICKASCTATPTLRTGRNPWRRWRRPRVSAASSISALPITPSRRTTPAGFQSSRSRSSTTKRIV